MNDPVVVAWFEWLNRTRTTETTFAPDVEVVFFPEGRGSEPVRLVGLAAVTEWGRRGPDGRFTYAAVTEPSARALREDLPAGARAVGFQYRVSATYMSWSNVGDDTLHVTDEGLIAGVWHLPEVPDQDAVPSADEFKAMMKTFEAEKLAHAHDHDHDHGHGDDT